MGPCFSFAGHGQQHSPQLCRGSRHPEPRAPVLLCWQQVVPCWDRLCTSHKGALAQWVGPARRAQLQCLAQSWSLELPIAKSWAMACGLGAS